MNGQLSTMAFQAIQVVALIIAVASVIIATKSAITSFQTQLATVSVIVDELRKAITDLTVQVAVLRDRSGTTHDCPLRRESNVNP